MVAILVCLAGLSLIGAVAAPFLANDPLGTLTLWNRFLIAIPGFIASIQFFAMALILDGVNDIRDRLTPDVEPDPIERIEPPSDWG